MFLLYTTTHFSEDEYIANCDDGEWDEVAHGEMNEHEIQLLYVFTWPHFHAKL